MCGFVECRGCCLLLGRTVENAPSHARTLLSFMRGSVGAPWGETTPRINDMRDMHCVTPVGCGGDSGLGYLNSPSAKLVNLQTKLKNVHRNVLEYLCETRSSAINDWCHSNQTESIIVLAIESSTRKVDKEKMFSELYMIVKLPLIAWMCINVMGFFFS